MNPGASNFVQGVDTAFIVILGLSFVLLIGITFFMVYFVIKYSKKNHPVPEDVKDSHKLEILWTVIPTILVLIMFYYGWIGYQPMREVPNGAIEIKATGRMWSWDFEYPNGKRSNILVVPKDKPVKLNLYSPDVLHSLYIPAFRIKEDVVPGRPNYMWFIAQELGEFDVFCAEYCGVQHSYMLSKVRVIDENEFLAWFNKKEDESQQFASIGEQILAQNGCVACHSRDGSKLVGPSFKGLYGTQKNVEVNGDMKKVMADDEYIKRAIYDPNAEIVEGFNKGLMVSYKDKITEDEIKEVVNYLKTLK